MKYVAKPIEVDAFVYGVDKLPGWWIKARRKNPMLVAPTTGTVVTKSVNGKVGFYDKTTFDALFESKKASTDLNKDGVVDTREKAINTEVKKKRRKRRTKAEMLAAKADLTATATVEVKTEETSDE